MKYHQRSAHGFVLLLSLVMLTIVSLIIFTAIEDSQLQYKMVSAWQGYVSNYLATQSLLLKTAKQLTQQQVLNCFTPLDKDPDLRDKSSQWWRSKNVCHQKVDGIDLAFQIEAQHTLPCTELLYKQSKQKSTDGVQIYRLSCVSLGGHGVTIMLQASIAAPIAKPLDNHICLAKKHLSAGIISWRQMR